MLKRGYKLIICVVLISALFIGFGSAFASAAEPAWLLRIKAAVAAAMLAGQLVINPVDVLLNEPIASGIDPEGQLPWVETLPEYLDKSVIRVYPDVVTIDGVPYSQIWIGPDAADSLRLKGLDFASAYNILNNQSQPITYASGVGYVGGIPIYDLGENAQPDSRYRYRSESIHIPPVVGSGQVGDYTFTVVKINDNGTINFDVTAPGITKFSRGNYDSSSTFEAIISNKNVTTGTFQTYAKDRFWNPKNAYINASSTPFRFDYTSGVIDVPIAEDDGLLLTIPSSYSDPANPQYNFDIHDLINLSPTIVNPGGHEINIDPALNPDFQTDVDLGNGLGDLIRIIIQLLDLIDNIKIEYSPEPDTPTPVPDPDPAVPDTPVSDQDGSWLDELLRWIKNAIDTISQTIINAKDAIQNEIQDLSQTISEIPEQILQDIETGPSKVFRKALDILKSLFMPLLLPIKAMMGLWHYVVEWIGSVTSPFTWIFGIMSSTSYNMVLPIYAMLAGSICIAIYKALGR